MKNEITVIALKNPFNVSDREITRVSYIPGASVYTYVEKALKHAVPETDLVVSRNGKLVQEAQLKEILPRPGDYIAVCPVVGKDRGKNPLAVILSIALMTWTASIGGGHEKLFGHVIKRGFWSQFLAVAVNMLGGALINHLFPPATPDEPEPSYAWGDLQPLTGQGNALAVTYGTVRTAGQILAQHITSDGNKQYLNLLLCGGEGPIDSITDIRINDNPYTNYKDVTVYTRLGTNEQEVIANFNDTYADQALSYELKEDGVWATHQTEGDGGQGLEIVFEFPLGLYHTKDDGGLGKATVKVQAQYRRKGETEWTDWSEWTFMEAKNIAVRKTCRIDNLPMGRYEVRCRCTYKSGTSTRDATRVYWTQLSHIIYDDFARPGKVLIGIKALATDQLSGGMPTVTWLQTVNHVNVWNPNTGQYEQKPARNPAWAAYDLIHRCRKLKNIHTGQDEYVVFGRPAARIDYQAFADWAAFCTEKNLQFEFIFDTASDLWSALQKPESVGRGKVILKGTRYSCVCDRPSQPVQLFTVGNMLADRFHEEFLGLKDRANAVEITFTNKDKRYERDTVTVYGDDWDTSQTVQNPTQITLYGCTSYEQAVREGKYRLNLNKYLTRTVSFDADVDAIACQVGDVILVQHDVPQWGFGGRILSATADTVQLDRTVLLDPGKNYTIVVRLTNPAATDPAQAERLVWHAVQGVDEITETDTLTLVTPFATLPQAYDVYSFGESHKVTKSFRVIDIGRSQEFRRTITALEYVEQVYAEATDIPVIDYSSLDTGLPEVMYLDVAQETYRQKDGTVMSVLHCAWVVPRSRRIKSALVWYSEDDGQTWVLWGNTTGTHTTITGLKSLTTYRVKVCTVNELNVVSPGVISVPVYITGKDQPPADVTAFTATQAASDSTKIYLEWSPVGEVDLRGYEIREGASWDEGTVVASGVPDTKLTYTANTSRQYKFHIKAMDNSYNYSTHAREANITVIVEPAAVTGFTVTQLPADRTRVNMTWDANREGDIAYYEIRQGTSWDSAVTIATQMKATRFEYQLPGEGNYTFWIKAVNVAGKMSLTATSYHQYYLLKPNKPAAGTVQQDENNRAVLVLSWNSVADTDLHQYEARLGTAWDSGTVLVTTKETSLRYPIAASGNYNFMVRAINVGGYYSNILNLSIPAAVEPSDVTGFTVSQMIGDHSRIRLEWEPVPDKDLSYYELREGISWDAGRVIGTHITGVFFDTVISEERTFTFWVAAVNVAGKYSLNPVSVSSVFNMNPTAPGSLTVTTDPNDKTNVILAWAGIPDQDLQEYELRVGLTWETGEVVAKTKELRANYRPPESGIYKFILRARNIAGYYSDEVTATFNAYIEPADVTNFQAVQAGEYILMTWDKSPEPDVVAYEIREGATFGNGAAMVVSGLSETTYQVKIDTETTKKYHIKAINRAGKYSRHAASTSVTIVNLPLKNVIQQYDEMILQNGFHNNTEFAESQYSCATLPGKCSDYTTLRCNEVGGQTVLRLKRNPDNTFAASGEYTAERKDMGRVITANLKCEFVSSVLLASNVTAKLQYRISTDENDWTEWRDFFPTVATFRYLEFKVLQTTSDMTKSPEVNIFKEIIDVPDTDKYGTATVAPGGTTVSYGHSYYTTPAVLASALGEGKRAVVLDIGTDGFAVKVVDAQGNDTGGQITWLSKGY